MANTEFFTRLQLKYDSYANWSDTTVTGQKGNLVLLKGEIGICTIPSGANEAGVHNPPHIMFKVGDGTTAFHALPWASAKAADVHAWAKEDKVIVSADGTGNVVASISWDESLNGGKGGIKYTTASVATSEGLKALQDAVDALTKRVGDLETGLANEIKAREDGDKALNDAIAAAEGRAAADATQKADAAEAAAKGHTDEVIKNYYTKSEADAAFMDSTETDNAIDAKITALKLGETYEPIGAETRAKAYADGLAGNYATAEQGAKADSAVQPEDLGDMAKETAANYVKKTEAPGYDDILTKTAAQTIYVPGTAVTQTMGGNGDATKIPSTAAVAAYVKDATAGLTGAMHFIGKVEEGEELPATANSGDVVLFGNKEYVWDGAKWVELGDEGSLATGDQVNAALAEAKKYTDDEMDKLGSAAYTEASAYATAEQGGKADSAVQKVTVLGKELTDGGSVSVDEAKTALGLGSAAYTEAGAYATAAQGALADTAVQPAAIADMLTKTEAPGYDDILTKTVAATTYQPKGEYASAAQGALADTAVQPEDLGDAAELDVATAISPIGAVDNKLATEKAVADALTTASTNFNNQLTNAIGGLDSVVTGEGPVVTNVAQVDGKVNVTKGNITLDQVAANTKENYVIFNCGSSTEVI